MSLFSAGILRLTCFRVCSGGQAIESVIRNRLLDEFRCLYRELLLERPIGGCGGVSVVMEEEKW